MGYDSQPHTHGSVADVAKMTEPDDRQQGLDQGDGEPHPLVKKLREIRDDSHKAMVAFYGNRIVPQWETGFRCGVNRSIDEAEMFLDPDEADRVAWLRIKVHRLEEELKAKDRRILDLETELAQLDAGKPNPLTPTANGAVPVGATFAQLREAGLIPKLAS